MIDQTTGRREFLRGLARWPLLAAVVAAGVCAGRRREGASCCPPEGLCRNCPALAGCALPAAAQEKNPSPKN